MCIRDSIQTFERSERVHPYSWHTLSVSKREFPSSAISHGGAMRSLNPDRYAPVAAATRSVVVASPSVHSNQHIEQVGASSSERRFRESFNQLGSSGRASVMGALSREPASVLRSASSRPSTTRSTRPW
eukprot:TRINITY_DN27805_c0_g1_i4.p1 TRINITY_DN27805_c0_g1~~TRINITY_DN27805_c0_g1_i4.p1  ORF type:complete len:129 (+),score=22.07 TRINITY_DN27805_c0_g1_i4:73-459(+)